MRLTAGQIMDAAIECATPREILVLVKLLGQAYVEDLEEPYELIVQMYIDNLRYAVGKYLDGAELKKFNERLDGAEYLWKREQALAAIGQKL